MLGEYCNIYFVENYPICVRVLGPLLCREIRDHAYLQRSLQNFLLLQFIVLHLVLWMFLQLFYICTQTMVSNGLRSLTRDVILSLFTFKRKPEPGVRSLIAALGLAGSRRGHRAGRRPRDVNINTNIPVVIGRRHQLIRDRRLRRLSSSPVRTLTTVRRHANLSPISIGTFNARSIHNKFASITEWISDRRLHVAGVVETWHDSHDDLDLVACCPAGFAYVDKSRPRAGTLATNLCTNHGGVVLFLPKSIQGP